MNRSRPIAPQLEPTPAVEFYLGERSTEVDTRGSDIEPV